MFFHSTSHRSTDQTVWAGMRASGSGAICFPTTKTQGLIPGSGVPGSVVFVFYKWKFIGGTSVRDQVRVAAFVTSTCWGGGTCWDIMNLFSVSEVWSVIVAIVAQTKNNCQSYKKMFLTVRNLKTLPVQQRKSYQTKSLEQQM